MSDGPVYESMVVVQDALMAYEDSNGEIVDIGERFTGVRARGHYKGKVFAAIIPMTENEIIDPELESKVRKIYEALDENG